MEKLIKEEDFYFNPWRGSNYGSKSYEKLLIFGESGYTEDSSYINNRHNNQNIFINVIQECLEGLHVKAYKNLGRVFNERQPMSCFNDIAFVNGIQDLMFGGPKIQPTEEQILSIKKASGIT